MKAKTNVSKLVAIPFSSGDINSNISPIITIPNAGGSGNDANTKLLLHCDGVNGSTSFSDASASAHSITANGTAQVTTSIKKFGIGGLLLDGNSDYLTAPDSDDWSFGSEDFTIDFWTYLDRTTNNEYLGQYGTSTATRSWILFGNSAGDELRFVYNNGSNLIEVTKSWAPSTSTWYHIAVVRNSADLKMFIDGTQIGSTYNIGTATIASVNQSLYIGRRDGGSNYIDGVLDEIRISDVARWTSDFTPPTGAYT